MTQGTELSVEGNADAFAARDKGNNSSRGGRAASENNDNNNSLYDNKYT